MIQDAKNLNFNGNKIALWVNKLLEMTSFSTRSRRKVSSGLIYRPKEGRTKTSS